VLSSQAGDAGIVNRRDPQTDDSTVRSIIVKVVLAINEVSLELDQPTTVVQRNSE